MANRAVPATHQAPLPPAWQLSAFDSNWDSPITALNDSSLGYVNGIPTDTGSANNYLVSLPFGTPSSYQQGMTVTFKAVNANTANSTLTVSPLTAVQLVNIFGNPLVQGDILPNAILSCTYNGTAFVVLSPILSNLIGSGVGNFSNARVVFDDFFGYPSAPISGGVYFGPVPWLISTSGSGSSVAYSNTNITAAQKAFGELLVNMGTTSTALSRIVGGGLWSGLGAMELDFRFNLGILPSTLSSFTAEIGLDDFNADQQNAVYIADFVSAGSPVWQGTCQNGGVASVTSTIAAATGYNRYRIVINGSWTSVSFFQGATQIGTAITTNIPTGKALYPVVNIFSNGGTGGANTYIDQFYMSYLYNS